MMLLITSQAFDRVWNNDSLYKLKRFVRPAYSLNINFYLSNRHFQICSGSAFSDIAAINDCVPQRVFSSLILYNIYVSNQPNTPFTFLADYVDDNMLISINVNLTIALSNLQNHIHSIESRFTKWRYKVNSSKSIHTTFTLDLILAPTLSYIKT